jgi:aminoglycoside phosphotransferase (APT) family kinase protein
MFNRKMDRHWAPAFARLSALLDKNGIRTARVHIVENSLRTWRQYGFSFLAEEFLNGRVLVNVLLENPGVVIDNTADLLLRLHTIKSPKGGKPWEGQNWNPQQRASELSREHLARLQRLDIGLDRRRSKTLATWFAQKFRLFCQASYPLVHGDFHGRNILLLKDGRLGLIDLATVSYGFPQVDLVEAEICLFRENATACARFLARYFTSAHENNPISNEHYETTRPVFVAFHHIIKAGRKSRRIAKGKVEGAALQNLRKEAISHWERAKEALSAADAP